MKQISLFGKRWPFQFCLMALIAVFAFNSQSFAQEDEKTDKSSEKQAEKQDDDDEEEEPSVDVKIRKVKSDLVKEISKLGGKFRAAKTSKDRQAILKKRYVLESAAAKAVIKLTAERDDVKRNVADLAYFFGITREKTQEAVYKAIQKLDASPKDLRPLYMAFNRLRTPAKNSEGWIREQLKACDEDEQKARLTLTLANYLSTVAERLPYKGSDKYLAKKDKEAVETEIDELLNRCVEEYADVKAVAKAAKAKLTAMKIKIGAEAPDIVGVDIDDKEFKLSDYRGKVVLLDFWGDW